MVSWNALNRRPKGSVLVFILLSWVCFLHLTGLYLFTQPPVPPSPYHHNILTLPMEMSAKHPTHSLIFNAFADPPTSTMQRIKGITTGSLPTFIDITSNFGGSSIEEDSIVKQLSFSGKKVAFMGDDTWMTVFPTLFTPNLTFPYDSFNVEDLHTVDEGVIRHLFPLLEGDSSEWDVIIGHFLGVDHVGHRVGPDHPVMGTKLTQMNDVLRRVVDVLGEDTLLVVLGDHGMDRRGDHGGDGELETSSGLWIYSKGPPISSGPQPMITVDLVPNITFPGAPACHRWVQQIDLVPTLSLLLGLPIPFNNLGTVIPEVFSRSPKAVELRRAMKLNAAQIKGFLDAYRASPSGGELDDVWESLESAWDASVLEKDDEKSDMFAHYIYTRSALHACRALWAQFNVLLMTFGLVVLLVGALTISILYSKLGRVTDWEGWASKKVPKIARHVLIGAILGPVLHLGMRNALPGVSALDVALLLSSLASCGVFLLDSIPTISSPTLSSLPIPLMLHALAFMSNSFTFWEDRIILFLLISSLLPAIRTGITAPTSRLRFRILGFAALYAICVRLIGSSTVCREEQQPYCHVTFYASSSHAAPPLVVLFIALPTSLALPYIIRAFLAISSSDRGLVPSFLSYILQPALLASTMCWFCEWAESSDILGSRYSSTLRMTRTIIARCTLGGTLCGASILWWNNPLCVEIQIRDKQDTPGSSLPEAGAKKRQAAVLGYSNAYGSPFLLFWCIGFAIIYLSMQLTGQTVLALATVALLAHLEVTDSVRDVQAMNIAFASATPSTALDLTKMKIPNAPFTFSHVSVFAMLAIHTFFGTGHQATLQSLQWKSAFLLSPKLAYPFSPILVAMNTLGPHFLFALATPLFACWQSAPLPQPASNRQVLGGSLRAALGIMLYFSTLLLGSAATSAWLRRHLMVWKVFAPRFMAAAAGLLVVDFAVLLAVALGVHRTVGRVRQLFAKMA